MSDLVNITHYNSIAVVGLGQTGLSCVRYLLSRGIRPLVFDSRAEPPGRAALQQLDSSIELRCGELPQPPLLASRH